MSITSARKKKPGRGRPKIGATPVNVRLAPDLLERLDEWRAQQRPIPTRPEAIRSMVEATLRMLDKA